MKDTPTPVAMPVRYSKEFIKAVKDALPSNQAIHTALTDGSPLVGEMLYNEQKALMQLSKTWQAEMTSHFTA